MTAVSLRAVFLTAVSRRAVVLRVASVMAAGSLLLSGCGPSADQKKGGTVKGKLLSNGQALESNAEYVAGKPQVRVTITLVDDKGAGGGSTTVKSNGEFAIEGVAAGKYRLTVEHFDQGLTLDSSKAATGTKPGQSAGRPSGGGGGPSVQDRLKGKFSAENSRITITVPEGKAEHDVGEIDLEKEATWSK